MNESVATAVAENVVPLVIQPTPKRKPTYRRSRFKVKDFRNHAGSVSFRVEGYKKDGSRIRENYPNEDAANARKVELEAEALRQPTEVTVKATKLSDDQLRLCETAVLRLGDQWEHVVDAVDFWKRSGGTSLPVDTPLIDDAVDQYLVWLDASTFRDATKRHWKTRMKVFKNSVQNVRVSEVTPEFIEGFLANRNTSAVSKDTDRRAISRFFSWCIERPRRWVTANPCREVSLDLPEKAAPTILSLEKCKSILDAAQAQGGELIPYIAVCLFGGLRPFEAARLTWEQVNLDDGEIRLDATQTKTGDSRTIKICPTLKAWLKAYKGKPFYPANWRKEFDAVKNAAGFGTQTEERPDLKPWPADVLRHTAISHYFRNTGSYGFTAEQFGNSEAIIKDHYQGRVSSADTKAFYRLLPTRRK